MSEEELVKCQRGYRYVHQGRKVKEATEKFIRKIAIKMICVMYADDDDEDNYDNGQWSMFGTVYLIQLISLL